MATPTPNVWPLTPTDLPGEDGNHTFTNATSLTVGTGLQGALCYENDSDFFKFTATAEQVISLDLPVRPADYGILIHAPMAPSANRSSP
ncbi:MAG: hypothetical protein IPL78_00775 [Chloroflexi bacterium]|nr:hypothetical protein [Chloroflexota bacterium]